MAKAGVIALDLPDDDRAWVAQQAENLALPVATYLRMKVRELRRADGVVAVRSPRASVMNDELGDNIARTGSR